MKGIRVTAGVLRGRRIPIPPGEVRPTSSRAREAVFNILSDEVPGSRFLDLFAGSGIMSIEAISRGARDALAVESSRRIVAALERLAKDWELPLRVRKTEVLRFLESSVTLEPFDIVYVDPPYDFDRYSEVMEAIDGKLPLSRNAVVVVEHRKKRGMSTGEHRRLTHRQSRFWGQVGVEIFDVLELPDRRSDEAGPVGHAEDEGSNEGPE